MVEIQSLHDNDVLSSRFAIDFHMLISDIFSFVGVALTLGRISSKLICIIHLH